MSDIKSQISSLADVVVNELKNHRPENIHVKEFSELAIHGKVPSVPVVPSAERLNFITRMILSELLEMLRVCTDNPKKFILNSLEKADLPMAGPTGFETDEDKLVEIADGLADINYYIYDFAARHGINLHPVFQAVHKANMDKRFPDGTFHRREDGKVIKPLGWEEPDVRKIMKDQIEKGSW